MATDAIVRSRIDKGVKDEATKILADLGLTVSDGIKIFMNQVVINQGLPFPVSRIPSVRLMEAVREIDSGGGKPFSSVSDLMEDLLNDDDEGEEDGDSQNQ